MYYEDIRIYRDHKNMTNRLNNCEQANIEKVLNTSNEQLKMIDKNINIKSILNNSNERLNNIKTYIKIRRCLEENFKGNKK